MQSPDKNFQNHTPINNTRQTILSLQCQISQIFECLAVRLFSCAQKTWPRKECSAVDIESYLRPENKSHPFQ